MNPFRNDVYDTNLVSIAENYRNSFSYNRYSRAFGAEWVNSRTIGKQVLANGYEIATQNSNQLIAWLGFSSGFGLRASYTIENRIQESGAKKRGFPPDSCILIPVS